MWRADTNNCTQSARHSFVVFYTFYHQTWKPHWKYCCPGPVQDWQLCGRIPKKPLDICAPSRDAEGFLLSQFPAHQGPNSSEDGRTVPGTASKWWNNMETQQPLVWWVFTYGGYAHPFRFISASTYGALLQAPPTGTSVFPEDARSLFIHFCSALVVWLFSVRQKRSPVSGGQISPATLLSVWSHTMHVEPFSSKAATFPVLQTPGTPVELLHFIHLSTLLPRHLMWQPVLKGALIAVTPMGVRGTYLCCSRQLSLRIM